MSKGLRQRNRQQAQPVDTTVRIHINQYQTHSLVYWVWTSSSVVSAWMMLDEFRHPSAQNRSQIRIQSQSARQRRVQAQEIP